MLMPLPPLPSPQCFAHFHLYLKGREELVVTVCGGPEASPRSSTQLFRAIKSGSVPAQWPTPTHCFPPCSSHLLLLLFAALALARVYAVTHTHAPSCLYRTGGNAFPPASPATHELDVHNPEVTVFLIGAYAKYNWPYVWVGAPPCTLCDSNGCMTWVLSHQIYIPAAEVLDQEPDCRRHRLSTRSAHHQELEDSRYQPSFLCAYPLLLCATHCNPLMP